MAALLMEAIDKGAVSRFEDPDFVTFRHEQAPTVVQLPAGALDSQVSEEAWVGVSGVRGAGRK